ncbi:MAG: response regulator, partial [Nocardiopsaceae bacterium]|nr:response regulator [Nocardiopsaceae bacterium]
GRPAAGSGATRGPAALRGKKVLVVDDDPRNVFAITSTLELHGMTVLRSADGQAGIDQLRRQPDTDLVLMDLMMPGMDGYDAISAIRDMPEFSRLPIIAVTAHTMTGELAGGVPGADACLAKPLDPDELLGRMRAMIPS